MFIKVNLFKYEAEQRCTNSISNEFKIPVHDVQVNIMTDVAGDITSAHKIKLIRFMRQAICDWETKKINHQPKIGNGNEYCALADAKAYVESCFNI